MHDSPSGTQWMIKSGDHEAVVVEVGGGLRAYRSSGREVVDGYQEAELCPSGAGQILAPWPNRLRDGRYTVDGQTYQLALSEPTQHNAIHGLVRWAPWRATEVSDSSVTLEYRLPAQPGYPWTLQLSTTWELDGNGLRASHAATNLSGRPAPFGLGAHPYLAVPGSVDDVMLTVPARSRLLTDARDLPIGAARVAGGEYDFTSPRVIGATQLNTSFGDLPADGSGVVLSTVDGGPLVTVWADESFRWWQLYTADGVPAPRTRRSVAIEPMTCPPDALRSGRDVVTLGPGETWRGSWGISPAPGR